MPPLGSQASPARAGGKTQQGRTPAPGQHMPGSFRPPARPKPSPRVQSPAPAQSRTRQRKAPARPAGGTSRRQIGSAATRTARSAGAQHLTDYQKVIAAEFVLAELLVAATPVATRKNTPGLSPYQARDMTKLLALGMVYFLLELLSIPQGWGRLMAWFGGLVLLTVGLNEAANIASDLNIFGSGASSQGGGSQGGGSQGGGSSLGGTAPGSGSRKR